MKILSLSDVLTTTIYNVSIRERYGDIDMVIGCGDLPYYYLEFIVSMLDVPTFFVRGNHDKVMEYGEAGPRASPHGAVNLHRKITVCENLILAGIEGSLRYRIGPYQYTQGEMWNFVLLMVPALLVNKLRFGRFLDILVTHAAPWGIHDQPDLPHQGIKAFRWLNRVFQPAYHLHGHVHVYRPDTIVETLVGKTHVVNTYGARCTDVLVPGKGA